MEGHTDMEILRTVKGSSTGEVNVHLVARDSAGPHPQLPTTAFIIPTNAATLGLPSTALDVPYPREPVHVGALERVAGSEPVTATILPQLSTGTGTNSTVRLLDWTGVSAPLPGSGMRFRINEYAPLNMIGVERPRSPEQRHEGGMARRDAGIQHPDVHQDRQDITSLEPPVDASSCCDGSGHVTGKFTAHHCLSGCPLAEKNQSRLKAELSDSETAARKKNPSNLSPRKKPRHQGRIGRPPKYRKIPEEDLQALPPSVVHQSLFMSTLPTHADRPLSVCWEQHCKLLPGVAGISASTVSKWTIEEVFGFVQTLTGSEDQARLFKDEIGVLGREHSFEQAEQLLCS